MNSSRIKKKIKRLTDNLKSSMVKIGRIKKEIKELQAECKHYWVVKYIDPNNGISVRICEICGKDESSL